MSHLGQEWSNNLWQRAEGRFHHWFSSFILSKKHNLETRKRNQNGGQYKLPGQNLLSICYQEPERVNSVDPWTTRVWTSRVQLYVDFFSGNTCPVIHAQLEVRRCWGPIVCIDVCHFIQGASVDFGIHRGPGNNPKGQQNFGGVRCYTGGSAPLNPMLFKHQLYSNSIPVQDLWAATESNYFTNHLHCWLQHGDYHLNKANHLAGISASPGFPFRISRKQSNQSTC